MPVKCDICGKEFKNKAGLAGHMKIVHDETKKPVSGSDALLNVHGKETKGCQHIWKRLTMEQLRMEDSDGKSLADYGYKYYCADCGEVK